MEDEIINEEINGDCFDHTTHQATVQHILFVFLLFSSSNLFELGGIRKVNSFSITFDVVELVIEGDDNHSGSTFQQASELVVFHAAVNENHFRRSFGVQKTRRRAADFFDEIQLVRIFETIVERRLVIVDDDFSKQRSVFAQNLRKTSGVDALEPHNALVAQPLAQASLRVPVREVVGELRHDES